MSIGKILDQFKSGEITKQEAVTKLQKNRNRHAAQEANKELDRYLGRADPNLIDYEYIKSRQLSLTADKEPK